MFKQISPVQGSINFFQTIQKDFSHTQQHFIEQTPFFETKNRTGLIASHLLAGKRM